MFHRKEGTSTRDVHRHAEFKKYHPGVTVIFNPKAYYNRKRKNNRYDGSTSEDWRILFLIKSFNYYKYCTFKAYKKSVDVTSLKMVSLLS